jgi:hypothetical protein
MMDFVVCTSQHSASVAALWNAKTLDAASCWHGAPPVDAAYVDGLLAASLTLMLALDSGTPLGFGIWCGPADLPRLVALAADSDDVYYRLLDRFATWAQAGGATRGFAEIDARPTSERARMNALGVITYLPIGYEPLTEGQIAEERTAVLFRAEADLAALQTRLAEVLEGGA